MRCKQDGSFHNRQDRPEANSMTQAKMTPLQIPGPQGVLEAKMNRASGQGRGMVVLCHPHPAYGGSLNDRILELLSQRAHRSGFSTLAFNVAGVGASSGHSPTAAIAAKDLAAVIAFVEAVEAVTPKLLGYSFGAITVLEHTLIAQDVDALLIAPVLALGSPALLAQPTLTGAVIVGSADGFAQPASLHARFNPSSVQLIEGADHFFNGYDVELVRSAEQFFDGT
jgi:alpha/beta superfamily hydrolase|tara:strand:- start:4933 stop:5607 length:675 start_codon:yes stop_codon:yes gene_type:complete